MNVEHVLRVLQLIDSVADTEIKLFELERCVNTVNIETQIYN